MLNRLRVVTLLMCVMVIFAILQILSSTLLFSSLKEDQQYFLASNQLKGQESILYKAWNNLLQTRIYLSQAAMIMTANTDTSQNNPLKVEMLNKTKQMLANAQTSIEEFNKTHSDGKFNKQLDAVLNLLSPAIQTYYQGLSDQMNALHMQRLDLYNKTTIQTMQQQLEQILYQYETENTRLFHQAYQNSQSGYNTVKWQLTGMVILLLVIILILWRIMNQTLVKPLHQVIAHIKHIASGNLTGLIHIFGSNEIANLAQNVKHMQYQLSETVNKVRIGTDAIGHGTKEIVVGNRELSSRTEQQVASLEETAASTEQLTATVKQNAENARQASHLAQNASEIARHGGSVVDKVVSTMHEIDTSSRKISDITGVIDSIAFQTNILALNAAVEAARAGEQGRGFAVVAGEVRNLASRSAEAAKEIKALIEDSVSRVNLGSSLVESAGDTMKEIVDAVTRVTDIMGEIASASDEQSRGIDQVARAVSEMDLVTQQNAELVQQSASAVTSLEEHVRRLDMAVAVFQLNDASSSSTNPALPPETLPFPAPNVPKIALRKPVNKQDDNWETF